VRKRREDFAVRDDVFVIVLIEREYPWAFDRIELIAIHDLLGLLLRHPDGMLVICMVSAPLKSTQSKTMPMPRSSRVCCILGMYTVQ